MKYNFIHAIPQGLRRATSAIEGGPLRSEPNSITRLVLFASFLVMVFAYFATIRAHIVGTVRTIVTDRTNALIGASVHT